MTRKKTEKIRQTLLSYIELHPEKCVLAAKSLYSALQKINLPKKRKFPVNPLKQRKEIANWCILYTAALGSVVLKEIPTEEELDVLYSINLGDFLLENEEKRTALMQEIARVNNEEFNSYYLSILPDIYGFCGYKSFLEALDD